MSSGSFHVQSIADLVSPLFEEARVEIEIAAVFLVLVVLRYYIAPALRRSRIRSMKRRGAKVCVVEGSEFASSTAQVLQLLEARQGSRALQLFRAASRQGNLDMERLPTAERPKFFQGLVAAAAHTGHAEHFQELFVHLGSCERDLSEALVTSWVKICASRQFFGQAVTAFNMAQKKDGLRIGDSNARRAVLHCAFEAGGEHALQLPRLFKELKQANVVPNKQDYSVMIRFHCRNGEPLTSAQLLQEMQNAGVEIDAFLLNSTISALTSVGSLDEACQLLRTIDHHTDELQAETSTSESPHGDTISYNMLMKGYAKLGRIAECTSLFELMQTRQVKRSQVTYGILMDAYINHDEPIKAGQLLDVMAEEGCQMNTVLYTLLIKGFVKAREVDMAMAVYVKMRTKSDLIPDAVLYSTLMRALCDASRLEDAIKLLEEMRDLKIKPDEVIFNTLIHGCSSQDCGSSLTPESKLNFGKRIFNDMLESGIVPSDCTFSIYIRLFTECKRFAEAVEMIVHEPLRHGLSPDPRLFSQLIVACIRERQGRRVMDAYKAMLKHSTPTEATHSNILKACIRFRMFETAVDILDLAADFGARVSDHDRASVLASAGRRVTAEQRQPPSAKVSSWRSSCSGASAKVSGRLERSSAVAVAVA